jgi:hypothetical protein
LFRQQWISLLYHLLCPNSPRYSGMILLCNCCCVLTIFGHFILLKCVPFCVHCFQYYYYCYYYCYVVCMTLAIYHQLTCYISKLISSTSNDGSLCLKCTASKNSQAQSATRMDSAKGIWRFHVLLTMRFNILLCCFLWIVVL